MLRNIALVVVLVCGIDLAARVYLVFNVDATEPPPYMQYDWTHMKMTMADSGWIFEDFHGRYFNIDKGLRRTTGQPSVYDSTVWVFGNSAVFDLDVPDNDTMVSQLQHLYNIHSYRIRVINEGTLGIGITGEISLLKKSGVRAGDTVLMYDGAVDGIDIRDPGCNYPITPLQAICKAHAHPDKYDKEAYNRAVSVAKTYAEKRGTVFYHMLQPCNRWGNWTPFGKPLIVPPLEDFISLCHLNPVGDKLLAAAVFDALTLI